MPIISSIIPQSPIQILNDNEFQQQAALYNWIGLGTKESPLIIENYNITATNPLIIIKHTALYFILRNCFFNYVIEDSSIRSSGIHLYNVSHAAIVQNSISNCADGISLYYCRAINIVSNALVNNWYGIMIESSHDTNITTSEVINSKNYYDEDIHYRSMAGISITGNSTKNCLESCRILNMKVGIDVNGENNQIRNNSIAECFNGMRLGGKNHLIQDNSIKNSIHTAINLNCNSSLVDQNLLYQEFYYASTYIYDNVLSNGLIFLIANHNSVTNNSFINYSDYAIIIYQDSSINLIRRNDFIKNRCDKQSQASDNGFANNFTFNYWDNWNLSANYWIDGSSGTIDNKPHESSFYKQNIDFVSMVVRFKINDLIQSSKLLIQFSWEIPYDSFNHSFTFELYYGLLSDPIQDQSWILIQGNLTQTNNYDWVCHSLPNGRYRFKIVAICTNNITSYTCIYYDILNTQNQTNGFSVISVLLICAFFSRLLKKNRYTK